MRNKSSLFIAIFLLILSFSEAQTFGARDQKQSINNDLIFPKSDVKSQFKNDLNARLIYDKMVESIRKAETLYYESECWSETILPGTDKPNYSSEKYKNKYRVWLKKPNLARMECFYTQKEEPYITLISDGDYFWTFWEPSNDRLRNVYMREPADNYSIVRDGYYATNQGTIIDPSLFYGIIYESSQDSIEAVRKAGAEKVGNEECDIIEISSLMNRISRFIWVSKADNLPRRLREEIRDFHHLDREIVYNELWKNVTVNTDIPKDKFTWKPIPSWQRITRSVLYSLKSNPSSENGMIKTIEPINLSGKWKYNLGDDVTYANMDYNDENWNDVDIPYLLPSLNDEKCVWFRKAIFVPEYYKEQKYMLRLGAFPASAHLYLNGELVGQIEKEKLLVSTKPLNIMFGKDNLIALKLAIPTNVEMSWIGEPSLKPLTGWIEKTYFSEEDFTVRHYVIYVPQNYTRDKEFPLVIAITGYNGGRYGFNTKKITTSANSNSYIIVCPDVEWKDEKEGYFAKIDFIQKEAFFILSKMKDEYRISPMRIYVMGVSTGGFATYYMGFRNSTLFAAIASISGSIGGTKVEVLPRMASVAKEHIPVYIIHGSKDVTIPITRANYMAFELKRLGYEYELFTYPEGDHSILSREDAIQRVSDFFNKHAKQKVSETWDKLTYKTLDKIPSREEKSIKNVIKTYIEGYNKKDIKQVMSCFSKEYYSDSITYPDVRNKTEDSFNNNEFINANIKDIKIVLNKNDVSINTIVLCILKHRDNNANENKMLWFGFAKENGNWKIIGGNILPN